MSPKNVFYIPELLLFLLAKHVISCGYRPEAIGGLARTPLLDLNR